MWGCLDIKGSFPGGKTLTEYSPEKKEKVI